MEELIAEMAKVVSQVGMAGLWTIVLYKLISVAETISVLILIWYGLKRGVPYIVKVLKDVDGDKMKVDEINEYD